MHARASTQCLGLGRHAPTRALLNRCVPSSSGSNSPRLGQGVTSGVCKSKNPESTHGECAMGL